MLETRLQISASFGLYAIEWIAVVVLHYYLLHRFTRRYSMMYTAEEGFSFGQGYAYILSVSTVAGLIVGIVQYLYLHFFIGYANYTERTTAALSDFIGRNGGVPANMESMLSRCSTKYRIPRTFFLRTLWAVTFVSILFGAVFGLIIAGVLSRAPKPFDTPLSE